MKTYKKYDNAYLESKTTNLKETRKEYPGQITTV